MTRRARFAASSSRIALAAPLFATPACGGPSLLEGARAQFANEHTCPQARVSVTERTDIPAHVLWAPLRPPADVASDPGRLAMWQRQQRDDEREADRRTVVDVAGCGHAERLACIVETTEPSDTVVCLAPPPPPADTGAGTNPAR